MFGGEYFNSQDVKTSSWQNNAEVGSSLYNSGDFGIQRGKYIKEDII